jgi:isopentenyldiphosphate isomerase
MTEQLDYVNENDQVLGQCTYEEARAHQRRIRIVCVLVVDADNRIILQFRHRNKKSHPRHYCDSAVGKVLAGESYERAAARELQEELNISNVTIEPMNAPPLVYDGEAQDDKVIARFYLARIDNFQAFQNDEAEAIESFTETELQTMMKRLPYLFAPGLDEILHAYKPEIFKL